MAAERGERSTRRRRDKTPGRRGRRPPPVPEGLEIGLAIRGGGLEDREGLLAIGADRRQIGLPRFLAGSFHVGAKLSLELIKRRGVRDLLANDPFAHTAA